MDVPVVLMGVPWDQDRLRHAAGNLRRLREEGVEVIPVWDEQQDAMETWQRAMLAAEDRAIVFIEDDVILVEDWASRVTEVVAEHPEDVIQMFSLTERESGWRPGSTFSMNQCHYLPAGAAAGLAQYAAEWRAEHPEHPTGYDLLMASWMKRERRRYWLHQPSLVQHVQGRSTIDPRRSSKRQSPTFDRQEAAR